MKLPKIPRPISSRALFIFCLDMVDHVEQRSEIFDRYQIDVYEKNQKPEIPIEWLSQHDRKFVVGLAPGGHLLVASTDEEPIAVARGIIGVDFWSNAIQEFVQLDEHSAHMNWNYVPPRLRGQRLGLHMRNAHIKYLKQLGISRVSSYVLTTNLPQIALNKRLGFKIERVVTLRRILKWYTKKSHNPPSAS